MGFYLELSGWYVSQLSVAVAESQFKGRRYIWLMVSEVTALAGPVVFGTALRRYTMAMGTVGGSLLTPGWPRSKGGETEGP